VLQNKKHLSSLSPPEESFEADAVLHSRSRSPIENDAAEQQKLSGSEGCSEQEEEEQPRQVEAASLNWQPRKVLPQEPL
jgi:hypothetical protein